ALEFQRRPHQAGRRQKFADQAPHTRRVMVIGEGVGVTALQLHPLAADVGGVENKTDQFIGHGAWMSCGCLVIGGAIIRVVPRSRARRCCRPCKQDLPAAFDAGTKGECGGGYLGVRADSTGALGSYESSES